MSQHTIERNDRIINNRRNPNARICPILAINGMLLTLSMVFQSEYGFFPSIMPILGMAFILHTINGSILHWELKPVRHVLKILVVIQTIRTGLFLSNFSIIAPLVDCPIKLAWGVYFIRMGGMFRKNPFLIRNEDLGKYNIVLNCLAGILFVLASLGEAGAFLGVVPPISIIETIASMTGCISGLITAISCSLSLHRKRSDKRRKTK